VPEIVRPDDVDDVEVVVPGFRAVEPAELAVSVVAAVADEPDEDPPQPAIIPETTTIAQQSVPRQDSKRIILEPPTYPNRTRSSEESQEADAMTRGHLKGGRYH
jgi:hypothetical protein